MLFHAKGRCQPGESLASMIKIRAPRCFRIDKGAGRGYHNFNSVKQSNAVTRRVALSRKPREKAAGASLRERNAANVP